MTPFDGTALLAMLLAFYPTPSPAALVQARAERPEYFSGATLIGRSGDKFQLPDGRIFDVIFAVDGAPSQRRWQMIEAVPGDASADPWPLEEGPLTPLDEPIDAPAPDAMFLGIVGGGLDSLGASAETVDAAHSTLADGAAAAELADAGGGELDDAGDALDRQVRDRGAFALGDELEALDGIDAGAASIESDNDEPPGRPSLPPDPTPTKPPDSGLPPYEVPQG